MTACRGSGVSTRARNTGINSRGLQTPSIFSYQFLYGKKLYNAHNPSNFVKDNLQYSCYLSFRLTPFYFTPISINLIVSSLVSNSDFSFLFSKIQGPPSYQAALSHPTVVSWDTVISLHLLVQPLSVWLTTHTHWWSTKPCLFRPIQRTSTHAYHNYK